MDKVNLYFKELAKIEEEYYNLISNFNFNFPKVLNFEEEKKKFFMAIADDKIYNPKFIFEKKIFDKYLIALFKNFRVDTKNDIYGFKRLYKEILKSKLYEIETHNNWGKPICTDYVIKYKGKPNNKILKLAKEFCESYNPKVIKFKKVSPKFVAYSLKKYLFDLTGDKIDIKFENTFSKVSINPKSNIININPNIKFRNIDINRLKVHEIAVHYMRYFNAKNLGIKLLETGTSNYIITEEGLAVYFEELKGVSSSAQLYIYAGRVIATYYALHASFYEVFEILKSYGFKDEDAFAMIYRAKRNLNDTSKPGGFTKDYVYFEGYHKIKKYSKSHDIRDLFIGKIKIEDLKILKKFIRENRHKIRTIDSGY